MRYLYIIILAILLKGCLPYESPPYDVEFNNVRKDVGLVVIDSTFKQILGINKDSKYPILRERNGVLPLQGMRKPGYLNKYTFLHPESGEIVFEEDVYASGFEELGIERNPIEIVIYRYFFEEYRDKVLMTIPYYHYNKLYDDNESYMGKWQYVYAYPDTLNIPSKDSGISYFEQKMKLITKIQADSILRKWKITKL